MESYSKEMRRDVLAACDAGEGTRAVALRFGCSESWVRRVKQERRERGKTAPATTRRRVRGHVVARSLAVAAAHGGRLPRLPVSLPFLLQA